MNIMTEITHALTMAGQKSRSTPVPLELIKDYSAVVSAVR